MSDKDIYGLYGTSELPHMRKLIINAALTGNYSMKAANPNVPYTPEDIADDARKCFAEGATMFHVHAREEDGRPSCRTDLFQEILAKVKSKCPGAVICVTTSGRVFKTFEERSAVISMSGDLKPDFASLSLGSMNFPTEPSVNSPDMISRLAQKMLENGIRPELEAFETGMVNHAAYLLRKGVLKAPLHFNLFFGIPGTMPGRIVDLVHQVSSIPHGSTWCAAAGGRFQLPVNMAAVLMGGHVRVGLEDNLYYDNEKTLPATNEMLVRRVVRIAKELGRPIASPEEARDMLGLAKGRSSG